MSASSKRERSPWFGGQTHIHMTLELMHHRGNTEQRFSRPLLLLFAKHDYRANLLRHGPVAQTDRAAVS